MDEGWLAPARPGPRRAHVAVAVVVGLLALAGWFLTTMTWRSGDGGPDRVVGIELNEFGRAIRTVEQRDLATEVRTSNGVDYLVVRTTVSGEHARSRSLVVGAQLPTGVDPERASLRVVGSLDAVRAVADPDDHDIAARVELAGAQDDLQVLLLVPASLLDLPPDKARSVGPLSAVTGPLDAAARRDAHAKRTLEQLRDRSPWLLPLLLFGAVGVPLLLWWRTRRRFFSMRRPGPGKDFDPAPPSSLDPVGAAVLVAGARGVDADAAFAGHVLDLVERRQLLMRRTLDADPGAGVLIGLGHADEFGDDAAVDALRAAALPDGITVAVTDSRAKLRRVPELEQDAWHLHVAARERFEGVVDRVDPRRLLVFAVVLAMLAIGALVAGFATDMPDRRALLWLAAATAAPAAVSLALWARDAASWRIVTRARRNERAQWIAWRSVVGTSAGPALDQRNLPVIAATGTDLPGVGSFAGPDAVALDAVTTRTIRSLRAMISDQG